VALLAPQGPSLALLGSGYPRWASSISLPFLHRVPSRVEGKLSPCDTPMIEPDHLAFRVIIRPPGAQESWIPTERSLWDC
jgi:hypothetical protein